MSQSLCSTCRHANIAEGYSESQRIVECHYFFRFIEWPVRRCSRYEDKRFTDVEQMQRIAWFIVPKKLNGSMGFVNAQEYKQVKKQEAG